MTEIYKLIKWKVCFWKKLLRSTFVRIIRDYFSYARTFKTCTSTSTLGKNSELIFQNLNFDELNFQNNLTHLKFIHSHYSLIIEYNFLFLRLHSIFQKVFRTIMFNLKTKYILNVTFLVVKVSKQFQLMISKLLYTNKCCCFRDT